MSDDIILNVGGTIYETTLATLRNIGGRFFIELENPFYKQSNGEIFFIDRDPALFAYILAYARTHRLNKIIEDVEGLLVEAEYYGYKYCDSGREHRSSVD
jgi:hypothetical protein